MQNLASEECSFPQLEQKGIINPPFNIFNNNKTVVNSQIEKVKTLIKVVVICVIGRCWVEIDLNLLKQNYANYKKFLKDEQEIIAVVKANAYGHGDVQVAKALEEVGVKHFAVATLEEGVRLRKNGIKGTILILSYTPINFLELVYKYDLMQTVISCEYARAISNLDVPIKVQIAVDTGMNRIGFNAKNAENCIRLIKYYAKKLNVVGLFTHLSSADNLKESEFTYKQIEQFKRVVEGCKQLNLEFVHCHNSTGGVNFNDSYFKFVRLGMLLYGLEGAIKDDIKPILKWKSVVSMVKTIESGENVGYGKSYITRKRTVVATISAGYADGYNRLLSNKGYVLINGQKASIIGKICMDQFMVDVTLIKDVKQGDEIELMGDFYSAEDMAKDLDTISYEIVCSISSRVAKVYTR